MTYTPKVGDRVRVTIEGEVAWENDLWAYIHTTGGLASSSLRLRKEEGLTVEKLADPEPTWVNGDVIEIKQAPSGWSGYTLHRINGKWTWPAGDTATNLGVTNAWKRDEVRIVHKHAENAA